MLWRGSCSAVWTLHLHMHAPQLLYTNFMQPGSHRCLAPFRGAATFGTCCSHGEPRLSVLSLGACLFELVALVCANWRVSRVEAPWVALRGRRVHMCPHGPYTSGAAVQPIWRVAWVASKCPSVAIVCACGELQASKQLGDWRRVVSASALCVV
mgnify:CR=1 FL=1